MGTPLRSPPAVVPATSPPPAAAASAPAHPRVSVVVSTCGPPTLLARCVEALLAQTLDAQQWELLIVDDGHGEETAAYFEKLRARTRGRPAVRYLRPNAPPRSGPATAPVSASDDTARTVPSTGVVASSGASLSWRSQPVTWTLPLGGAGTSASSGVPAGDSRKPRSTSTYVPSVSRIGTTTSTPRNESRI